MRRERDRELTEEGGRNGRSGTASDGSDKKRSFSLSCVCTSIYMDMIEPQLPWLQTAIHVYHTGIDVK